MGKSKRQKRGSAQRMNLLGQAPTKDSRKSANTDENEADMDIVELAAQVTKKETRGDIEKRHHREIKLWRIEEKDLRRQKSKVKGSTPDATKEKKRILALIKEKDAEIKERHSKELEDFLKAREEAASMQQGIIVSEGGEENSADQE